MFSQDREAQILAILKVQNARLHLRKKVLDSIEQLGEHVAFSLILETLKEEESLIFLRLLEDEQEDKAFLHAKNKIPDLEKKLSEKIAQEIETLIQL